MHIAQCTVAQVYLEIEDQYVSTEARHTFKEITMHFIREKEKAHRHRAEETDMWD
jgi:hypothetical protein